MPTTTTHTIKPFQARKGDRIVSIPELAIKTGKGAAALSACDRYAVVDVDRKDLYVVVRTNGSDTNPNPQTMKLLVDSDIVVERTEATEEEKLAERRQWMNESLAKKAAAVAARPDQLVAKLVALASDHWVARSAIEVGMEIAEAKMVAELMATVADLVESPDHDLDWVGAWEVVVATTTRQLLSSLDRPGSRSTSVASNAEEDAKNAGRAKFCSTDFSFSSIR